MTDAGPESRGRSGDAAVDEATRLFAAFVERARAEELGDAGTLDFDAFCAEHPEHADELRRLQREETSSASLFPTFVEPGADEAPKASADTGEPVEGTIVQDPGASTPGRPKADDAAEAGDGAHDPTLVHADSGLDPTQERALRSAPGARPNERPTGDPFGLPAIPDVTLEREIGRGGMGVVYVGKQTYLERVVAVKVMKGDGGNFAERFKREAKILASLSHPHIVACYQAGALADGQCYLVMEYIDGPNLHQFLQQHGPAPVDRALEICAHVAEALDCAHQQTIIHRDVKPANVLLQRKPGSSPDESFPYVAKLADLGLARPTSTDSTQLELTMKGAVMGSPPTMAPEQFDDPQSVDYLADVYGLGCVLFHLVTGRVAFPQTTLTATITSKMRDDSPDPRDVVSDLPEPVAELVQSMLARDRARRPQSYGEIVARCRELAELVTAPPPSEEPESPAESDAAHDDPAPARPRWPRRPLVASLGVVGLAVVGLALSGLFDGDGEPSGPAEAGAERERTQAADAAGAQAERQRPSDPPESPEPGPWPGLDARYAVGTDHEARVTAVDAEGLTVAVGGAITGRIALGELSFAQRVDPTAFTAGEVLDVRVLGRDASARRLQLSAKARLPNPWLALAVGDELDAVVRSVDADGADVELENGLWARLPADELSWVERVDDARSQLAAGDRERLVVTDVDVENERIAVSRRRLDPDPWSALHEGAPLAGRVAEVRAEAATLSFANGLVGRLAASDWGAAGSDDLTQHLDVGDELDVRVVALDPAARALSVAPDPWARLEEGAVVRGTVASLWSDGLAVELPSGLDGTVAARELSWTARRPVPAELYERGDELECSVLAVDRDARTVALSVRALESDPWSEPAALPTVGSELDGVATDFAALPEAVGGDRPERVRYVRLVDLAADFEGGVSATFVGDERREPERLDVEAGRPVRVRVLAVDAERRWIDLALLLPAAEPDVRALPELAPALQPGEVRPLVGSDPNDPLGPWRVDGHPEARTFPVLDVEGRFVAKGFLDDSVEPTVIRPFAASIELPSDSWQLDLAFGVGRPTEYWRATRVELELVDGRRVSLALVNADGQVAFRAALEGGASPSVLGELARAPASHDEYVRAPPLAVRAWQVGERVAVTWGELGSARVWDVEGRAARLRLVVDGPRSYFEGPTLSHGRPPGW